MKHPYLSLIFLTLWLPNILFAEGLEAYPTQEAVDLGFKVFEDFDISPFPQIVYQPILMKYFGIPLRRELRVVSTGYTEALELETFYYKGLEITVGRDGNWESLERVYITGQDYKLQFGLRVGAKLKAFTDVFGPRHEDDANTVSKKLVFDVGFVGNESADVELDVDNKGIVRAIEITYPFQ